MLIFALALTVFTAICGDHSWLEENYYSPERSKIKEENSHYTTRDVELKGCPWIVNGKDYSSGIIG